MGMINLLSLADFSKEGQGLGLLKYLSSQVTTNLSPFFDVEG